MIYAWIYNIDDPDAFNYFQNFKEGEGSIYPSITPIKYVEMLSKWPKDVLIFDTRNYGVLGNIKKVTLANSISNNFGKKGLFDYYLKNRSEFKDKKIVFICHGGHHAQNLQNDFADLLKKNNISQEHYAFFPGFMFQFSTVNFPPWIVQKVIYLPKSLINLWSDNAFIKKIHLKKEIKKDFWPSIKKKLSSIPGPIVIEGNLSPSEIEKNIYPLETERYYIWDNFLSPPTWIASLILKLSKIIPYNFLLFLFFSGTILLLGYLRWLEILKLNQPRYLRSLTGILTFISFHYFSQCFFQNHRLNTLDGFSYLPGSFSIIITLILLRILFNENKIRAFLNLKLRNPDNNFNPWDLFYLKRFLILLFPATYFSIYFNAQQWEPYQLINKTTFFFGLFLILYNPIIDLIFFISLKLKFLNSKNMQANYSN